MHKLFTSFNDTNIFHLEIKDISKVLFETAAEGLIVTDKRGVIQIINQRIEELFGYKKQELVGQSVEILVPQNVRNQHKGHREKYNQAPSKRTMGMGLNLSGQRKDLSTFPIEISLNYFEYEGNFMIMSLISDISQRASIQKELEKEKATEQMYLDIAGTMFVIIDNNGKVKLINQKGAKLLALKPNDIVGKHWIENFVPKEEHTTIQSLFNQLLNANSNLKTQSPVTSSNKDKHIISWNYVSIIEDGVITGILGSGEDITQQKAAEAELEQLNEQLENRVEERTRALEKSQWLYKMIARNFPNGVINVLDKNLDYIFVEGQEMYKLGITSEKLVGTNYLARLNKDVKDQIKAHLQDALNGKDADFELISNNNVYYINAVGLKDEENKVNQILVVEQNITQQKLAEEEIKNALNKERELNELKSRFVSMASHEFRTPLTTILSSTSLLNKYVHKSVYKDKEIKHISRIKKSVRDLTNMLEDFLSLDKLETGRIKLNITQFDLKPYIDELVDEITMLTKQDQQINYSIEGNALFSMDKQVFKLILNNLLSNAIKYSDEKTTIDLTIKVNHEIVIISVTDQGIGIPEHEQAQLFERFFRANNVTNIQGTGLGLSIVHRYLQLLNGSINFISKEGEGTTFTILLPQQLITDN